MKYIINILLVSLSFLYENCWGQNSISGIITDAETKNTVPGAIVYFPQLKLDATSDVNGVYKIVKLPKGTYTIQIQLLGYASVIKQINIDGETKADFSLTPSSSTLPELVITGLGNITTTQRSPTPVIIVSHQMLLESPATNVVDAIATQPGVTAITTGPGVSKPEINGLGFNRVITTLDGVRQQDFQWGDEHGIQIDPYAVNDVEILRGPATLQYGSDAMGGVVNFKSSPFPEDGTFRGSILSEYQTNNGLIGNSVNAGANHNGFFWDLRFSQEETHCYKDPKDGYVWGTAFQESNARLSLGVNKNWGYSRLNFSVLHRTIEIPDGNRDSITHQFKFDYPINGQTIPNRANFLSYDPTSVGFQQIQHDVVSWNNSINALNGKILLDLAYSQDHREEIDTGTVPLLNMFMHNILYAAKYQWVNEKGLKVTTGVNGMYEAMHNAPEAPAPYVSVFLVPNYHLFDVGGFAIAQKDFDKLTVSGGLRYDTRSEAGQSLYLLNPNTFSQETVSSTTPGAYTNFPGFTHTYSGYSGSLGLSYQLPDQWYVKANISKGYRAPAITEIGENGVHPGTSNYEIGDPNLKPESSYQADAAIGNRGKDVSFEAAGFFNDIQNFIFATRLASKLGGDSLNQGFPTFKFQSNTAYMMGVTATFNIHPAETKWIEINNGFTYIYSYLPNQTDSTQHVPWTPAPRLTSVVKFKLKDGKGLLRRTYVKVGLTKYWAQDNIYSANYTEFASSAYTLYNMGLGTDFVNSKTSRTICSLFINVTNLTNIAYQDHTSRLQYFLSYNGVTPVTVVNPSQGIYNMGRNIQIKLVFPFGSGGGKKA